MGRKFSCSDRIDKRGVIMIIVSGQTNIACHSGRGRKLIVDSSWSVVSVRGLKIYLLCVGKQNSF